MRRPTLAALSLAAALISAAALAEEPAPPPPSETLLPPAERPALPELPILTGALATDTLDLAAHRGEVMVINVWYEW